MPCGKRGSTSSHPSHRTMGFADFSNIHQKKRGSLASSVVRTSYTRPSLLNLLPKLSSFSFISKNISCFFHLLGFHRHMSVEFYFVNKTSPHLVNSGVALSLRLFDVFVSQGRTHWLGLKLNLHKSNVLGPPPG